MAQLFSLGHIEPHHFMNTKDMATEKRDDRVLSLTAFILFLAGFFLPLFGFIIIGCSALLLALLFGLLSWRRRLGKIAAIGAGVTCLIGVINLIRFYWS